MSETTKRTQLRRIDPARALLRELAVQDRVLERLAKREALWRTKHEAAQAERILIFEARREALAVQERVKQALVAYAGAAAADSEGGEK